MPKILWANMNSLLDTSSGASMSVRDMFKRLNRLGWETRAVSATCFDAENGQSLLERHGNISEIESNSVFEINDGAILHKTIKTTTWNRDDICAREEMRFWKLAFHELAEFKPDVVILYGSRPLDLLIQYEARYRGIVTAFYLVNSSYQHNRTFLDTDIIFTDSEATASYYRDKLSIKPLAVGKFIDKQKIFVESKERKTILFVNPVPAKGGFLTMQIVEWFEINKPEIEFDIVSSRGTWEEIRSQYCQHIGIEKNFTNVNDYEHQPDMRGMFARARITLVPSLWYESGARIIAESLINGIPCIATDSGGNKEMVGKAGTIINLPAAFHEKPFTKLLSNTALETICHEILRYFDEDFYKLKVSACRSEALRFDPEISAKKVSDALTQLISVRNTDDWQLQYMDRHLSKIPPVAYSEPSSRSLLLPEEKASHIYKNTPNKLVFQTMSGSVVKRYSQASRALYYNEKSVLEQLTDYKGVVTVEGFNDQTYSLTMKNAGLPINKENAPSNWKKQVKTILAKLQAINLNHNDIENEELLVDKSGEIKLVDFEYSNFKGQEKFIQERKDRIFDDRDTVNRLEAAIDGFPSKAELHCFILWDTTDAEAVRTKISQKFKILYQIRYFPRALNKIGGRDYVLNRIYPHSKHNYGDKGLKPFELFVVVDLAPDYKPVYDRNFAGTLTVNTNTHELKQLIRKGRQGYLHASNNMLEALDALRALTMYDKQVPMVVFQLWRPKFNNFEQLFEKLESENIKYCILRNHEMLPNEYQIDEHGDIDILVENYFEAKAALGGISYKHELPKKDPRWGLPYEVGGYKIANKVSVGGVEVEFDIRFVGDGYYDENWQRSMLLNREKEKCFYKLNNSDYFYSLLYHGLLHKKKLSPTYLERFPSLASSAGIRLEQSQLQNENYLWELLRGYMNANDYELSVPLEKNIPFNNQNYKL